MDRVRGSYMAAEAAAAEQFYNPDADETLSSDECPIIVGASGGDAGQGGAVPSPPSNQSGQGGGAPAGKSAAPSPPSNQSGQGGGAPAGTGSGPRTPGKGKAKAKGADGMNGAGRDQNKPSPTASSDPLSKLVGSQAEFSKNLMQQLKESRLNPNP